MLRRKLYTFAAYPGIYEEGGEESRQEQTSSATVPEPGPPAEPTSFSKNEVEQLLAQQKKATEDRLKKVTEELSDIQKSKAVAERSNQTLQGQLETLRKSLLSKEELAQEEIEKQERTYRETVEGLTTERDGWRKQFETKTVATEILSRANDAYNPSQFLSLLEPAASVRKKMDAEGKELDGYEVRIALDNLDLSVDDAIKRMKEDTERFGNLFKSNLKPGLGRNAVSGSSNMSLKELQSSSPADWAENRKRLGLQ